MTRCQSAVAAAQPSSQPRPLPITAKSAPVWDAETADSDTATGPGPPALPLAAPHSKLPRRHIVLTVRSIVLRLPRALPRALSASVPSASDAASDEAMRPMLTHDRPRVSDAFPP